MFRSCSAVGRDRHSCVLGLPCGYRTWLVHFGRARFLAAIPTEDAENGVGGEAKCVLCEHIGFAVFSAGSPLGATRPQTCAKESLTLWTLFIWVVMWVRFTQEGA